MIALLPIVVAAAPNPSTVTVNTTLGPIEGTATAPGECVSFYGVTYAAPPIGGNRFKPPQPATPWTTPRTAFDVPDSCLQTFGDGSINLPEKIEELLEKWHLGMGPMSEDCLFANVFSPPRALSNASELPIMVWFHGGSYLGGSGDEQSGRPFYDGRKLCLDADVVVVTVNYRLGVFGFFASEELRAEGGTAGNMGIQDQRAALQWVRANARSFGGRADKVTIFGESAGGGSVATHLTARHSAGLFSAAIMQSGGLWLRPFDGAAQQSRAFATAAGCANASLACLRAADALDLLHLQLDHATPAGPCADGHEFAPGAAGSQWGLLSSGAFAAVPVLAGTNLNESALFDCPPIGSTPSDLDEAGFRSRTAAELGVPASGAAMDRVLAQYNATGYGGSWRRAYTDLETDAHFYCDTRHVLNGVAHASAPTFEYRLQRTPSWLGLDPCMGVPHASDLFFLFGNFDKLLTPEEVALGRRMRQHWAAFAHTHAPAAGWPAYGSERRYLALNLVDDAPGAQWKRAQCDVLDALVRG